MQIIEVLATALDRESVLITPRPLYSPIKLGDWPEPSASLYALLKRGITHSP